MEEVKKNEQLLKIIHSFLSDIKNITNLQSSPSKAIIHNLKSNTPISFYTTNNLNGKCVNMFNCDLIIGFITNIKTSINITYNKQTYYQTLYPKMINIPIINFIPIHKIKLEDLVIIENNPSKNNSKIELQPFIQIVHGILQKKFRQALIQSNISYSFQNNDHLETIYYKSDSNISFPTFNFIKK
jgi:hypothetical protein